MRIGSANFTENRLLAEIYAAALGDAGVEVVRVVSADDAASLKGVAVTLAVDAVELDGEIGRAHV